MDRIYFLFYMTIIYFVITKNIYRTIFSNAVVPPDLVGCRYYNDCKRKALFRDKVVIKFLASLFFLSHPTGPSSCVVCTILLLKQY